MFPCEVFSVSKLRIALRPGEWSSTCPIHVTFGEFKNPITFSITVQFRLMLSPAVVVPIVMIFKSSVSLAGGTEINEDRFYGNNFGSVTQTHIQL